MSRKSVSALGVAAAMAVGLLTLPAQATDPPATGLKSGAIEQHSGYVNDAKTIAAAPMLMSAAGKQAVESNSVDMGAGGYALNGTWPADEITIAKGTAKAITIFTNNSAMNGATSLITANGGKLAAAIDVNSVRTKKEISASALSRAGGLFPMDGDIAKPYDGDIRHARNVGGVNTAIGFG